jgi:hypothetical protein
VEGVSFASLPADAAKAKSYDKWGKELMRWIQGASPITLYESKEKKAFSRPGESERDFRMRLADLGREARDAQADKLRQRYEPRFRTLQERLRRAEQAVEAREARSKQAMLNTGISVVGAMLGAAGGRKKGGLLGAFLGGGGSRAGTAMRSAGRMASSRQDIAHAEETVEAVQAQLQQLEQEFQAELAELQDASNVQEPLEQVQVRPALNAISMRMTVLAWLPWGTDPTGRAVPLWQ